MTEASPLSSPDTTGTESTGSTMEDMMFSDGVFTAGRGDIEVTDDGGSGTGSTEEFGSGETDFTMFTSTGETSTVEGSGASEESTSTDAVTGSTESGSTANTSLETNEVTEQTTLG